MATRWCPGCGSEWWNGATACRDCGASLVDQPPSQDPAGHHGEADDAGHEIAELELPQIDESGRWRLTTLLQVQHVMHRWRGTTLTLPAVAVGLVESELAEMEGLTGRGDPLESDHPRSAVGPPPAETEQLARPPRIARCCAAVLDGVVFVVVGLALGALTWSQEMSPTTGEVVRTVRPSMWTAVAFAAIVLGGATVTVRQLGGTPGMALAGVQVERMDGDRVGLGRSLLRAVVAVGWVVTPTFVVAADPSSHVYGLAQVVTGLWFFLLVGTIAGDPENRGLHDRHVGTVVRAVPRRLRSAPPGFRI
jgi:uncharacterized RDD family membrane protein YckC